MGNYREREKAADNFYVTPDATPRSIFCAGWDRASERIRQLEDQCAVLAAEVDAMRPVVEAAIKWNTTNYRDTEEIEFALDKLGEVCDDYEAGKPK